jgi:hypothetical protein
LFAFFFAFGGAFRIFFLTFFLELANSERQFISIDTQTDGQFGAATFDFGGGIQNLIRITGSQRAFDVVTFRLTFQTLFFAAFDFAFEVITVSMAIQAGHETIAIAIRLGIFGFTTFGEREFFAAFAIAARFRRRRGRGGVLRSGLFR